MPMHAEKHSLCCLLLFPLVCCLRCARLLLQEEINNNNEVINWTRDQSGLAGVIVFDRTFHCREQTSAVK
jgi:hypothetical protein